MPSGQDPRSHAARVVVVVNEPDRQARPPERPILQRNMCLWVRLSALMGYFLSMPSLIGAASLAGIVVNNAILLIDFIRHHRGRGLGAAVAAAQASRDRLRAILISSGTTIIGLVPLLAETSAQSASVKPLVISVVFGLLSATVLVVLVIPALYVLLDDWGWARVPEAPEPTDPPGETL